MGSMAYFSNMFSVVLVLTFFIGTECSNVTVPRWKDLECQKGHKYLFSEMTANWEDSRLECELYGGWLVNVGDLKECNCLMEHGLKEEILTWYWTDGNDVANSGVWRHANSNTDMLTVTLMCLSSLRGLGVIALMLSTVVQTMVMLLCFTLAMIFSTEEITVMHNPVS